MRSFFICGLCGGLFSLFHSFTLSLSTPFVSATLHLSSSFFSHSSLFKRKMNLVSCTAYNALHECLSFSFCVCCIWLHFASVSRLLRSPSVYYFPCLFPCPSLRSFYHFFPLFFRTANRTMNTWPSFCCLLFLTLSFHQSLSLTLSSCFFVLLLSNCFCFHHFSSFLSHTQLRFSILYD